MTKSTSQARIKPEIFFNLEPEPELDPKSPARLTTLRQRRTKTTSKLKTNLKKLVIKKIN